jgi:hypothetical protein
MRRVGDVEQIFVRQLAADLQQHGEPADAGVEYTDRLFRVPGSRLRVRVHGFSFVRNREPGL